MARSSAPTCTGSVSAAACVTTAGATLKAIAKDGRDAFYQGPVAEDIVATLKDLGGLHTVDDFAAQRASYVEPIRAPYGDLEICELPPSNQGIVALMMLNVLKHVPAYRDTQAVSRSDAPAARA